MVRTLSRLSMFVSSTSELAAERALLVETVRDVNSVIENAYGVTIAIVDWRRDIVPGVSSDPQQVINEQAKRFDIYFGMFGTRFGTPTPRAGSGTEEEFNEAYERFRADPTSVRLLFYFRTAGNPSVLDIQPEQLARVQAFRRRLGSELGVLYCDFGSPEDFIRLSRNHLVQLVAEQWVGESWRAVPGLTPKPEGAPALIEQGSLHPVDDDEAPTLLDLRVESDEAFAAALEAMRRIAEAFGRGAQVDREWQAQLERAPVTRPNPKQAQDFINAKAEDFGRRARDLRPLVAGFKSASDQFFAKLGDLIEGQISTGLSSPAEMNAGITSLSRADEAARAARDTYVTLQGSITRLPDATREFKRQKRAYVAQVQELNAAIGSWLDRSAALRARFVNR